MKAATYNGAPCKVCGGTERYMSGHLTCRGHCDEKHRAANRRAAFRYTHSEKGRATRAAYLLTAKGKATRRARQARYERRRAREAAATP